MSTDETRSLTGRLTAALVAGDAAGVAAVLADDAELQLPRSLDIAPIIGRDEVAAGLTRNPNPGVLADESIARETTLTIADGDGALVRGLLTAKTVGGDDYREEVSWVVAVSGGKVAHIEEVGDTLHALDAGVIEEVPAWS